jgi:hypothetical protein
MTYRNGVAGRLRTAIVLSTTEEACTVFAAGQRAVMPYADPFPKPRAKRVAPGHLVAVATVPNGSVAEGSAVEGSAVVVWRWFDAVVLEQAGRSVSLWEPGHGMVVAEPRDLQRATGRLAGCRRRGSRTGHESCRSGSGVRQRTCWPMIPVRPTQTQSAALLPEESAGHLRA